MERGHITIEAFTRKHLMKTFDWITDTDIRRLFLFHRQVSWEKHIQWFEQYKAQDNEQIFAIYYNDIYCGNCGLKDITLHQAEFWVYLDKNFWGQGVGTATLKIIIKEALKYDLQTLYLYVSSTNQRAIQLYTRIGFSKCNEHFEKQIQNENIILCKYTLKLT